MKPRHPRQGANNLTNAGEKTLDTELVTRTVTTAIRELIELAEADPNFATVAEAWPVMAEADRSLIFSLARRALGNPVWGSEVRK